MNMREQGYHGEDLAEEYLIQKGYRIVKKNFQFSKSGEIDIIAFDGDVLCFIEVKMRSNNNYGDPLSSITPAKIKKIRRTAEGYLYVNKIDNQECRFDVVSIDNSGEQAVIDLLVGAFY
jgi:putative endonuclease